jgi:hypothetical protein
MRITEVWAWLLTVSIPPGFSSIKFVMNLASQDINRKPQTTDIVITSAPLSGLTMEQLAQMLAALMVELLVMVRTVDV